MKKLLSVTVIILFLLNLFLPAATLFCFVCGYSFSLFSYGFFSAVICVISLFAAVISLFLGEDPLGKVLSVFSSLLPMLTVINCIFSFFKCSAGEFFVIGATMLIALSGAAICAVKTGAPMILNACSISASLLAVIPIGIMAFFIFAFADFGENTVVKDIPSPDGQRYIEVVDNDQGALGGATVVRVCEDKGIDCFVFKTQKTPERVYVGEWREYVDLNIYWKDNNCIVIGSEEYKIK